MQKMKWHDGAVAVFDEETNTRIEQLLTKKYRVMLRDEDFRIESGSTGETVQVRITLAARDGSRAYPVEAVVVLTEEHETMVSDEGGPEEALALLMVDYLDAYWNEYFTDGRDTYLPLDWSKHECEGQEIFLRGSVRDLKAEALADELLRTHGAGGYDIEGISAET